MSAIRRTTTPATSAASTPTSPVARSLAAWTAHLERHATWLTLIGALLIVLALYGRALGFTFFFDEPLDLTRIEGGSYWTLLTASEGYQYYRPIPFLIWKMLHAVQGHYDPALLHAFTIVAHALTGWLLYLLLRSLGARHWGIVPAILFLTNPFHYQVVPMVSTVFHALAGAAILASLTLYLHARQRAGGVRVGMHLLALGATLFALWTHESGVAIAPLVVGLELVVLWCARSRRPCWWLAGHLIATLVFLIVWATVEKAPNTEPFGLHDLHPKVLFFLQGFTYPVSAQITWLHDHLGISVGVLEMGMLGVMAGLGAYAAAARRARRRVVLAIPLAALAVSAATFLPVLVRLSWTYVQDSPRLLYLPAIGAAIFWGMLPSLRVSDRRVTGVWRTVTLVLLAGVVAQSWVFIEVRMDMYAQGSTVIDQLVAIGDRYRGHQLLVVNAPSWLAQERYEYPYGHLGVPLMPAYIGLDGMIYANSRQATHVDVRSASWNLDVAGGRYPFGPHGPTTPPEELDQYLREGRELVTVAVAPQGDGFVTRDVGRLQPGQAEIPLNVRGRIGSGVWLGTMRTAVTLSNPQFLTIFFTWQVEQPPGGDYDTLIHVRDEQDQVVAVYRGYALDGVSAPRLWQAGDAVADSIAMPIPDAGIYSVWAGMQRVQSDERAPAYDAADQPLPDNLVPIGEFSIDADGTLSLDGHQPAP